MNLMSTPCMEHSCPPVCSRCSLWDAGQVYSNEPITCQTQWLADLEFLLPVAEALVQSLQLGVGVHAAGGGLLGLHLPDEGQVIIKEATFAVELLRQLVHILLPRSHRAPLCRGTLRPPLCCYALQSNCKRPATSEAGINVAYVQPEQAGS